MSLLSLLSLLIVSCASTPEAPTEAKISGEVSAESQVLAVDKSTRELTLERPDGDSVVVVAGPEILNFDQIEAGDTVSARYRVSLSARLLGEDEVDTQPTIGLATASAEAGARPRGEISADLKLTMVVKSVDHEQHLVVLVAPDGAFKTVQAEREEGMRFVAGLEPGDRIELEYSESVVLAIE